MTKEQPNGKFHTLTLFHDQSCLSAKEGSMLGVACGKGRTFMIDTESMEVVSREKGHNDIVTGAFMTRGKKFITGSSSCSYLVQ